MSDHDRLASLLRAGGPRPSPDPERAAQARVAVHAEWRAAVAQARARRRSWLAVGALAATVAALGFFAMLRQAPAMVATLALMDGEVTLHTERAGTSARLLGGDLLYTGDVIETTPTGRALLEWSDAATLRLDRDSRVQFASNDELRLLRGKLYVETHTTPARSAALTVHTPRGEVRHVGTRYEVQVSGADVRVRVRDGVAIFTGEAAAPVVIEAGRQLSVGPRSIVLEPGAPAWDESWEWTQRIAPVFAIEGRSLFEALEWLAHEAGMRVTYESPIVREKMRGVVLHGSIEGLDLRQALSAVLSGSGVSYEVRGDRIEVGEPESR